MKFLQLSNKDKVLLINQLQEETGLHQVIIEKDLWVTAVLRALFQLPYADNLSFKGGTSLSKCWNLIERFSEDIDIAINREYFGYTGDSFTVRQISKHLRKEACKFSREKLQFDLTRQLLFDDIPENLFQISMDITPVTTVDPERIFVEYQSVFTKLSYIKNIVIVEIGGRSMKEPIQKVAIQSLIDQHFATSMFVEKPFELNAVLPERTFLEKVCLLHEEFWRQNQTLKVERMSRHLYDIAKLIDFHIDDKALTNKNLYLSIIEHRRVFIGLKDFDYSTLLPKTINIIPPDSLMAKLKEDYQKMQSMIYGNRLPFSELIFRIKQLNDKLNKIDWE
jgi:hypothetical protein